MAALDKDALPGRWIHSHEEDSEDEMVFRPATRTLPRSRGRTALELRADGSYLERSPGPVDLPVTSSGRWSLAEKRLKLSAEGEQQGHEWEVVEATPDRLTVRTPR